MINKLKENKLILIIFIIGIILIVTGVTYSLYNILFAGKKEQTVVVGNINFTYNEKTNGLSLNNDDILDNTSGINQEKYFDFDISLNSSNNTNITYQIAIEEDKTNTLSNDKIKLYLTDQNNNKIKEPVSISDLKLDDKGYRKLYINTINQNGTQKYRLRAWVDVDKAYEITNNGGTHSIKLNSSSYKFKVNVYDTEKSIDESGANAPVLASNMIPVYYDETNNVWKKADSSNTNKTNLWYSYESNGEYKGMWANAVTVKDTNRQTYLNATPGTIIPMDDITTMWVWIPRFNAVTPSNYNGGTKVSPGAIDITFVKQNETAIDAFTFGNKELSGFWYGKFEVGHTTLASSTTKNNLGCTNETCSNANGIIIKPNVTSLRNNNPSNFFFASRSMEQPNNSFGFVNIEVDTHMSKNNEWGAVAYLTHSIYGRCTSSTTCTEVYINNSSGMDTGRSGGNVGGSTPINGTYTDQTSTTQYNAYGFYTYDDYLLNYNTNTKGNKVKGKGTGASTTGTIYGIYDMSGGTAEYVMGVYSNTKGLSGFNSLPDEKYYNNYTESSYTYHALTETNGWYSDAAYFASKSYPWFKRGGYYGESKGGGVFNFSAQDGGRHNLLSSRFVITNE